ncbi:MAG: fasciclin domain-containing protein [Prolixibacteraceae bacterium]|jgi:uncharacterized surface protein with fasciclin (FAS1) repeats|nr:fasciclin domain-containing protein [Prolixibacteraceae bacterium]
MNKYKLIISLVISLFIYSCENPWDEHIKVNDNVLQESIGEYLASNSEFSTFEELLISTGLDAMLSSSVIYTVWTPTNEAMNAVDESLLNTDEKKKLFVLNHIAFGSYSSKAAIPDFRLKMRSDKILNYSPVNSIIDNVNIETEREIEAKNGTVQVINSALSPRYTIWEYIELDAPDCEFVNFLNSLTTMVFYEDSSLQVGVNESGKPVYDSVWVVENDYLKYFVDVSSENILSTLLIPSDEVLNEEFNKFEKYYRKEDKRNNDVPSAVDSVNIKLMIARDMAIAGSYSSEAADTLRSFYNVKVPFVKNAVINSFQASNGYVHLVNECPVKITDKIRPILMEAENHVFSTQMSSGNPATYFRLRDNASNGMDFICDNSHNSEKLSGVVFAGPIVSSIKYRIKIRAIDDFGKSYRRSDTTIVLTQKLGTVTVSRDKKTNEITTVSEVTNSLNYQSTAYGTADVTSDTIHVTQETYSPASQAMDDEIDVGFYEFNKSENVFLRLLPLESQMAVTADYFRLVPIIEE